MATNRTSGKKVKTLPAQKLSARKAKQVQGGLVMHDTGGKPVARYHLETAWPTK